MSFVQIIAFKTVKIADMQALMDEFSEQDVGDSPGFRGSKLLKDREVENRFLLVAEFDSYAEAIENSNRPETDAFAERMAALCDGPPVFANYDLLHEGSAEAKAEGSTIP